jgi:hypothetical protein
MEPVTKSMIFPEPGQAEANRQHTCVGQQGNGIKWVLELWSRLDGETGAHMS